MMHALAVRFKKVGEDGGAGERLDELKGQAGGEGRVAEFEGVGGGVPAVGLPGCVGGRAGVDGPGAEAKGAEGSHGEEVGAGDLGVCGLVGGDGREGGSGAYDADFYWLAEEGGWEGGGGHCEGVRRMLGGFRRACWLRGGVIQVLGR